MPGRVPCVRGERDRYRRVRVSRAATTAAGGGPATGTVRLDARLAGTAAAPPSGTGVGHGRVLRDARAGRGRISARGRRARGHGPWGRAGSRGGREGAPGGSRAR